MSLASSLKKAYPEEPVSAEPHSVELEQALLGAVLVNNEAYYRVSDFLEPGHFYEPIHQQIFEIVDKLIRGGRIATPITVKSFIPPETDIAGLTPAQYLARLAAEATTILNAQDYGASILDYFERRQLLAISDEIAEAVSRPVVEYPARKLVELTEERLLSISVSGKEGSQGFVRLTEALKESVDMAAKAYQREGGLSGTATGLIDLDHLMGGLQRSDLIIVAGRPGIGKTALVTNISSFVARNYLGIPKADGRIETADGGIVGFFSLEMSREQLSTRIASDVTGISSSRIRRGEISEQEFSRLAEAAQTIQTWPIYIEDAGGLSISQVTTRARRLRRQRGLDLMVVDYLQLMRGASRRDGNRVVEVAEITTGLKALAKELDVPIIALSQLSRQVESRDDKRPQLSDLRESGSIEQDADVVIFVYREEYYLARKEPKAGTEEWFKWEADMKACEGIAELIVGKQRHGPTGTVKVAFDARYTRFGNLAREDRMPERRPSSFKERNIDRQEVC